MKNSLKAFVVGVGLGLFVVLSAFAGPVLVPNAAAYSVSNCDGGRTVSASIMVPGDYLVGITTDTVSLCYGDAGCDVGGHPFASGQQIRMGFPGATAATPVPVGCRSPTLNGGVTFTLIAPGT